MRDLRTIPIYFRLAEDELLLWSCACMRIRMIRRLQKRLASDEWETLRARDEVYGFLTSTPTEVLHIVTHTVCFFRRGQPFDP